MIRTHGIHVYNPQGIHKNERNAMMEELDISHVEFHS